MPFNAFTFRLAPRAVNGRHFATPPLPVVEEDHSTSCLSTRDHRCIVQIYVLSGRSPPPPNAFVLFFMPSCLPVFKPLCPVLYSYHAAQYFHFYIVLRIKPFHLCAMITWSLQNFIGTQFTSWVWIYYNFPAYDHPRIKTIRQKVLTRRYPWFTGPLFPF